jgi:hypothetical protein
MFAGTLTGGNYFLWKKGENVVNGDIATERVNIDLELTSLKHYSYLTWVQNGFRLDLGYRIVILVGSWAEAKH